MANYTKLFNSIITSTIWTEDDKTRIVWITMLAMSDQHGEVQASIPGIARLAGVTLEDAEMAIGKLLSPDKHSRTPGHEGRRIAPIDGGWELLNHAKYRAMASVADRKEATANRVKRHRARNADVTQCNADVTQCNASVTQCNASVTQRNANVTLLPDIAEAEAEVKAYTKKEKEEVALPFVSSDFAMWWKEWEQHRKEKKQPLTPTAKKQQLAKLKEMGELRAIDAMRHSIANGWTGMFEPNKSATPPQQSTASPERAQLMADIDSLLPAWAKVPWTGQEIKALEISNAQFANVTETDWQMLAAFYASPSSKEYWRPDSRQMFFDRFASVLATAERWKKATSYRAPNSTDRLYY